MSLRRRIATGSAANLAGIAMGAVLQLLNVPILISAWGQEGFGLWIMLSTIPTYFALSDLGFVQAATTDMTISVAQGNKTRALATFQSISALFAFSSIIIVFFIGAIGLLLKYINFDFLYIIKDYYFVLFLLIFYSILSVLSRITLSGFRSTGNYAIGSFAYDMFSLLEGLAALATAYLGGTFVDVACCLILMRMLSMAILYKFLRLRVAWLYLGLDKANITEVRRLSAPALAALAIPAALAINLQGVVLIIGAVLSPASVAIFTPLRTLSRLVLQLIGVVNRASMPEIGHAAGAGHDTTMYRLVKLNILIIASVLIPGAIAFAIFGQQLIALWSRGLMEPPTALVVMMAIGMAVQGSWNFLSNIALAKNQHIILAKNLLVCAIISICVVFIGTKEYGLIGTAGAIIIGELINLWVVAKDVLSQKETKRTS